MKLTQEKLKELLDYAPANGVFVWKVDRGKKVKKGDVAGSIDNHGYWCIKIESKRYLAHRLAFLYMEGYFPENQVDHIDRNRSNNEWKNLREVSQSCNMRNCKIRKTNKSGITGVCWHKKNNKWTATIRIHKKNIDLGRFDSLLDAAKARWNAEVKYGYPNCNTTSSAYTYLKDNNLL